MTLLLFLFSERKQNKTFHKDFSQKSPWNIKESLILNNTACTYNTPCIFFSLYLIIDLFIHYSFCGLYINNLNVWGTLMQLYHDEINFPGYIRNSSDPKILFHNLLSKNYCWKNTLTHSKVLICYEIERSSLKVWR